MHLPLTMKSVVLIIALAMQCVPAKSRSGYDYFDEKFCVLEWITYLKRFSLIALMLCGIVLYYVPESRSCARRICCALIDLVANGLKNALNMIETEGMKMRVQNGKNKEPRIQELYRKASKDGISNYGKNYISKMNIKDRNHKSMRKHDGKKSRIKSRNAEEKHERRRPHHYHHYRNAAVKDVSPESGAVITSVADSSQQMAVIDEKYVKDNIITLQDISPKTRIAICNISMNKLEDNTDLGQERPIKNHEECTAENTRTESFSHKKDSSTVPEIINKIDIKYQPNSESNDYENCKYISNNLSTTKVSDNLKKINYIPSLNKEFQTVTYITSERQELNEKNALQYHLKNDCATRIMNKQKANLRYEGELAKHELRDKVRRENPRFLHDIKRITHDYYENPSLIRNRVKPVLLRVVNWLFGSCPEASKRHREQVDAVGKEEISEFTNTWLL